MIIENEIEIVPSGLSTVKQLISKTGKEIKENIKIKIDWKVLRTTAKYRNLKIELQCDDCKTSFLRRIRGFKNLENHFCKNCILKGERNYAFGKPASEASKIATSAWIKKYGNPLLRKEVQDKLRIIKPWEIAHKKNLGSKRSIETKIKMSNSAIEAFKKGTRKPSSGWGNVITRNYKHLTYQSTYELKFIKYVESLGYIDSLIDGPTISYFDVTNKERLYYIDFQIKKTDVVFEIKSFYTWKKNLKTNLKKKKEAEKKYKYYIIKDNRFNKIKSIFDNLLRNNSQHKFV